MDNKLAYIVTDNGIAAIIDGETLTITSDNPSYGQVVDAIKAKEDPARIAELFRTANAVRRYMNSEAPGDGSGRVEVRDGEVFFEGVPVHNIVVDRILKFMSEGLPVEPLIRFLEKLMKNPSRRATEELYTFLENGKMPLTEDGNFLAYKGVDVDYMDQYSHKFDNHIGAENSMPRSKVDDDFRVGCSYGFHVGSLEYATGYGPKTVIVEVDPADVVSVPEECEYQKMRCCRYRVVAEYQGPMNRPLVSASRPYDDEFNEERDERDESGFGA